MAILRKIIFLLALVSCSEDEPTIQMGCMTGVNRSDPTKTVQLIRCCTREQYLAGSNTDRGGTDRVKYFINLSWQPISDCNQRK